MDDTLLLWEIISRKTVMKVNDPNLASLASATANQTQATQLTGPNSRTASAPASGTQGSSDDVHLSELVRSLWSLAADSPDWTGASLRTDRAVLRQRYLSGGFEGDGLQDHRRRARHLEPLKIASNRCGWRCCLPTRRDRAVSSGPCGEAAGCLGLIEQQLRTEPADAFFKAERGTATGGVAAGPLISSRDEYLEQSVRSDQQSLGSAQQRAMTWAVQTPCPA